MYSQLMDRKVKRGQLLIQHLASVDILFQVTINANVNGSCTEKLTQYALATFICRTTCHSKRKYVKCYTQKLRLRTYDELSKATHR